MQTTFAVLQKSATYVATRLGVAVLLVVGSSIGLAFLVVASRPWPVELYAAASFTAAADSANSVTLTWTAPGDDGASGQATSYTIRYSTQSITDANWGAAAAVANPPTPKAAGQTESFLVTGLQPETTYYFALKTYDEAGNASAMSNSATKTTGRQVGACIEYWQCGEWAACTNSQQARTCTDASSCGTVADRPPLSQACQASSTCTEDWACGAWSACTGGSMVRTCGDRSACGTVTNKPAEQFVCSGGHLGGRR